jgi:hypothetical protein
MKRVYEAIAQLLIQTAERAKKDGDLSPDPTRPNWSVYLLAVIQWLTFLEKTGIDSRDLLSIMDGARHLLRREKSDEHS